MKITFSSILFFAIITSSWSQTPELVKEIRPGSNDGITYFLEQPFTEFNGRIYFAADDGTTGTELWVSDGTDAGTKLLKDLNEGSEGSDCQKFYPTENYLFFVATDEEHGRELWRTDGTEDGTQMIMDINIGAADGVYYESLLPLNDYFFAWNDVLYFTANDGQSGVELWRSDGTEGGTYMIKDINGSGSSNPLYFDHYNNRIYFRATGGIWATDGTEAGTVLVKPGVGKYRGIACNGYLLFIGNAFGGPPFDNQHLWRSDGTDAGTVKIAELDPDSDSFVCSIGGKEKFVCINNIAYIIGTNNDGKELWRSDGTEAGTFMVKDASNQEFNRCAEYFTVLNDVLYYSFNDGVHGQELWRSDGTEAGTYLLKDLLEGPLDGITSVGEEHVGVAGDKLLFAAAGDFPLDWRLWWSDGTEEGTVLLNEGNLFSFSEPQHFTVLGDYVYFTMDKAFVGFELYRLSLLATNTEDVVQNELDIDILPSVTNSKFILQSNLSSHPNPYSVSLFSLSGQVMKEWQNVLIGDGLEVAEMAEGIYLVRISNKSGSVTKKLVISNQ